MSNDPQKITPEDVTAGRASINQYRAQEGITAPPPYCTERPTTSAILGAPCGACGHAMVLHIGVGHCPACELEDLNRHLADSVRRQLRAEYRRAAAEWAPYRRPDGRSHIDPF